MDNNKITEQVMSQIDTQHIQMRPKWYFILGSLLISLSLACIVICGLFIFSDVFFHIRSHGPFGYLQFGSNGIQPFLQTFPVVPLFIGIFLIVFGSILLIRFTKAYHYSMRLIISILVIIFIIVGFTADYFGLNEFIAQNNSINQIYTPFVSDSWIVGEITAVNNNNHWMDIRTPYGDDVQIVWDQQTLLPVGSNFKPTDRVRIIGDNIDGIIHADGITIGGMGWRNSFPTLPQPRRMFFVPPPIDN